MQLLKKIIVVQPQIDTGIPAHLTHQTTNPEPLAETNAGAGKMCKLRRDNSGGNDRTLDHLSCEAAVRLAVLQCRYVYLCSTRGWRVQ